MPELPEVETARRGLAPKMEGRTFNHVQLRRKNLRFPFPKNFIRRLQGVTLDRLSRRAKFLVGELSSGETLLMHLGMSGKFSFEDAASPAKHDHVVFTMSGKDKPVIIYNDPRRFGFMELLAPGDVGRMAKLGPEPLSNGFSGPVLRTALAAKKSPIKTALLDQHIVAGLGNIYVCEALFLAGISPLRRADNVSPDMCEQLCAQIKKTLQLAIKAGGSSLKDFAAADGALGYFQHQFQVYDKEGAPCPKPKCPGSIIRTKQSGRSSFYCPDCQI